ncbi:hemolysin family protein [Rhodoplanes sp. SY1]|uniref:hemolysin family protein n=1 Tax=Rhodoplanes sp. SY1 TaxID=3166646 RepID=UPI0038B63659
MPDEPPSRSEPNEPAGQSRSAAADPPAVAADDARGVAVPALRGEVLPREAGEGWVQRMLRALFGWKPGSVRSDIAVLLEGNAPADADSGFSAEERTMLKNILGLRERRSEDIMVPRADIVAVQRDISLGELVKVFEKAGHSRLVVYDDTLDDPVGMVHIRDLVAFMANRAATPPPTSKRKKRFPADLDLRAIDLAMPLAEAAIVRDILFVPPSMPALDLLAKMQASHVHLALVIDEYGGTDGVISIEDLVEQIVGDIEDEHDEHEARSVVRQPDGSFLADARAPLEDVTATVGAEFDVGDAAEEVDTIGGYLVTRVGRVPVRGEIVPGPEPFEIEVLDADPRRVKRVKITRSKQRRSREARRETSSEARAAPPEGAGPPGPEPRRGAASS